MTVLLGIGILALVALVWATGAILMHVRRARQAERLAAAKSAVDGV